MLTSSTFHSLGRLEGSLPHPHLPSERRAREGSPVAQGASLAHLGQPRSLDEVVEFAHGRLLGKALDVSEEVLGLGLEEAAVVSVL